jgi:hypothetical protein
VSFFELAPLNAVEGCGNAAGGLAILRRALVKARH